MRQFCVQQLKKQIFGLLRSQIICRPIATFKSVLPPLFACTILTAYSQFSQLILRNFPQKERKQKENERKNCCHQMSYFNGKMH